MQEIESILNSETSSECKSHHNEDCEVHEGEDLKKLNKMEIDYCFKHDIGLNVLQNENLKTVSIAKSKILNELKQELSEE